ncbi:polymorphic repeat outer membrane protein, putative [Trichomonas vaginalis G3]|uniref:Polymorphic repeat outer membrane protein, putative n=1 Tax=Trichomonas vaginalis (strain ATCC PRA-98 / G3) TaxID=412133 RepID=A2DYI1_TRIV3|nr:pectin lyase-like family [Trichomonas vaginalis G3]EAY14516.1 polymorphic repeat outer membrane protein, putative [Trichomonas vaginalis G3]KAI5529311.1 pectin lyase-like family [Trichomonas vaginalis G3]|eukprot:XP_001326739.1 polymorphic repeat outer membrane protein [Trichomonas vaginalis G3]
MFAFFFVISISVTLKTDFITHQPDFQYNPQLDVEIAKRINSQVSYEATTESDKPRYQRNYFRCVVKTLNSEFSKCYAFGVGLTMGSGGALYLSVSNLDSKDTTFKENLANNGGALSIIGGDVLISSSTFDSNTAYENSGSIFISASKYGLLTEIDQDVLKPQNTPQKPNVYIGESTTFTSNSARNSGGAIYVRSATALIANKVTLDQNSAQLAGSALYLDTTPANVISSTITSNKIEYSPINTGSNTIFGQRMFKLTNQANGGAICVFTPSEETGIYTESNTFSKNSVTGQYSYLMKVPADMSFAGGGPIQWISNGECQLSYSPDYPNLIVSLNSKDCGSDNPYIFIESNGLGIPEEKAQNFEVVDYNIQTSYTPYNERENTPSPNPEETNVPVEEVPGVLDGKMNGFKTISVTPPTPSRSPVKFEIITHSGKNYRQSTITTKIETITLSKTMISSLTTTLTEKERVTYYAQTYVQVETDIETITIVDVEQPNFH